jgi:hypothetical protein
MVEIDESKKYTLCFSLILQIVSQCCAEFLNSGHPRDSADQSASLCKRSMGIVSNRDKIDFYPDIRKIFSLYNKFRTLLIFNEYNFFRHKNHKVFTVFEF